MTHQWIFPRSNKMKHLSYQSPKALYLLNLFYLSSNILINRTRYSPRSYTKLVLGLEPKLGCSRTSHSKLEPEYIPMMNVTGFGKLPRRNHSGCRAARCPAVSHSALITFLHRESRPQRLPQFLWCFALWLSPSNYHPLFYTVSLVFKGCM